MRFVVSAFALSIALIFVAGFGAVGGSYLSSSAAPIFVTQEWHDHYLKMVPDGVFSDNEKSRMIFYDKKVVRRAYQMHGSFHDAMYNVSPGPAANPPEPFGNANREFPWNTGGLDNSPNGSDFKAMILSGPIKVSQRQLPYGFVNENPMWNVGKFQTETKFCEFLVKDNNRIFEVRVLEKVKEGDVLDVKNNWKPHWFRAVKDSGELIEICKDHQYGDALASHYAGKMSVTHLTDKNHNAQRVLNVATIVDELPPMPKDVQDKIYIRPFQEVTDVIWHKTDEHKCYGPSGGFVADKYQGGHFASTQCIQCHHTVLSHAQHFGTGRDWYGRLRGTDGIFSVPIADDGCISGNGFNYRPVWNQKLVKAGLLVSE